MYKQSSLFPGIDEKSTAQKVYEFLENTYQRQKDKVFMLDPSRLKAVRLSADKVDSSPAHNTTEDQEIRYLDAKTDIDIVKWSMQVLNNHYGGRILQMRYIDAYGMNTDVSVARNLNMITKDSNCYVDVPSKTYWNKKRREAVIFAQQYDIYMVEDRKKLEVLSE
ncbi:hypothetical protein ACFIVI_08185 [Oenococcus oeni]|uniref:hypothetical protein n=1 Tax=Oenococcus oeni TaxID=1247 RepID=UPI003EE6C67E